MATDTFKFPGGSFVIKHKVTRDHSHFSNSACAGTERQRGTHKISHGTASTPAAAVRATSSSAS